MGLPRQEYWNGCHFLLQGIFPTQGPNQHLLWLLYWQAYSLPLCHLEQSSKSWGKNFTYYYCFYDKRYSSGTARWKRHIHKTKSVGKMGSFCTLSGSTTLPEPGHVHPPTLYHWRVLRWFYYKWMTYEIFGHWWLTQSPVPLSLLEVDVCMCTLESSWVLLKV